MKNLKWVNVKQPIIKKILPMKTAVKEKETKLKKVKIAFLILCVLFSISLGANIIMFLNSLDKKITSNLGSPIICEINQSDILTYSIYHPSGIVGGNFINQELTIKNNSTSSQYIRIKATSNNNNSNLLNASLNVNNSWVFKNNYYYLNYALSSGEEIQAFNKIAFLNNYSKHKNSVTTFQIECFNNLDTALLVWDEPENWLS